MPLCPQITNTAIPVVLTADFTITDVVPVLAADTEQLAVTNASVTAANAAAAAANATAVAAQASATTALANAAIAFNAAVASLQPSANTIVNAQNQMTAIASNGITVFSGASSTSGARVVLNSVGLAGFNSSNAATFSISATTGAAVFSGSVTGSTITASVLNIGGRFFVDGSTGILQATDVVLTGKLTSNDATITGGSLVVGTTFSVTSAGVLTASSGTIGGSTLASSTITGGTIQTASSGSAVILDGSNGALKFRNSSGTAVGWILPYSADGMVFNYGSSPSSAFSVFPAVALGSTSIILQANSTHAFSVSTSGVNASSLSTTGTLTANGELFAAGHSTTTNAANAFIFTTGGRIARSTASSVRYKENIVNLSTVPNLDAKKLLELPVRAFTYKEGYLPSNDKRYEQMIPGFIAEEVASIYGIACDYVDENQPESWNDRMIVPAMLALIQDLYKEIDTLKGV